MSDRLWKKTERAIAKRLGGQRVGATGKPGPDVVTSTLSVEVKTRKTLPKWLKDALAQATNGADGRLPVVIIHQPGNGTLMTWCWCAWVILKTGSVI